MSKHHKHPRPAPSRHVFVGVDDLMARYGRGRSTIYLLVKEPDFPGEVAPGRWRLDQVEAREERVSRAGPNPKRLAAKPRGSRAAAERAGEPPGRQPSEEIDVLGTRRAKSITGRAAQ